MDSRDIQTRLSDLERKNAEIAQENRRLRRSYPFSRSVFVACLGMAIGAILISCGGGGGGGGSALAAAINSLLLGDGLVGDTTPIEDGSTISVDFSGTGAATTVSRSDHNHSTTYLDLSGGTLTGDLDFGSNEILSGRVHNSATEPAAAAAGNTGQLWFDTANDVLKVSDGAAWNELSQTTGATATIHTSTQSGPTILTASSSNQLVRTVYFTPDSASDVPLQIMAYGTYTGNISSARLYIRDNSGNYLTAITRDVSSGEFSIGFPGMIGSTLSVGEVFIWPDTQYRIDFLVDTGSGAVQIDTLQFKVIMLEGATEEDPSGNFSG